MNKNECEFMFTTSHNDANNNKSTREEGINIVAKLYFAGPEEPEVRVPGQELSIDTGALHVAEMPPVV